MNKLDVIKGSDIEAIIDLFKEKERVVTKEECAKQYDVNSHDVFDPSIRKDRIINKDVIIDGVIQTDENGNPKTTREVVPVTRIGIALEPEIVEQRIGFMLTRPVSYNMVSPKGGAKGKKLIELTEQVMMRNRMDFRNKEVLRRQLSEMECARLWYYIPSSELGYKFSLRCKIFSPSLGDTLIPLFDDYGDLIAFGRKYKIKEAKAEIEHFDIYTNEFDYKYALRNSVWALEPLTDSTGKSIANPTPNIAKKIMLAYYEQPLPEWHNATSMRRRLETSHSNHADMNDTFGSPILAVTGEVQGFAAQGEQGKILQLEAEAKANYLQLTTPPQSILKEQAQLRELAYSLTNTADISFDKVKGIGNLSAVALSLLFVSSTMAAKTKEETFAIGLQRELNIIMAAIGAGIDTSLESTIPLVMSKPQINVFIPEDVAATMKMLAESKDAHIMSTEAIVQINPYINDKEKELALLKAENSLVTNAETPIVAE